jgi:hypothetical protein
VALLKCEDHYCEAKNLILNENFSLEDIEAIHEGKITESNFM